MDSFVIVIGGLAQRYSESVSWSVIIIVRSSLVMSIGGEETEWF